MSARVDGARTPRWPASPARVRRAALALTAALGAGMLGAPPAVAAADPVTIDVVTINDFHGRIEADGAAGGAAALATAVAQVRAANPNTIFAAAGDLIGASTFTSFIQHDDPTIDALNAAGLEVSAAGNHEFDQGWADLRDRVVPRADWDYIGSNVVLRSTGEPALAPSWVKEVDGIRVGFIGAVTEELGSLVSPAGIADLEVRDIVASVNAAAGDLTDGDPVNGEADVIILLVHEGASTTQPGSITPDSALGKVVYGVDKRVSAIVSAHTHLVYNHVIDGRPVVSAGQYGENVGLMTLQVDPGTKQLVSIGNRVKPLTANNVPLYPADPDVQAIVNAAAADAAVLGARPVGAVSADIGRARQADGKTENRGGESTLGNFVADVQKWSTGADLAVMNPGGLRANLTYASSGPGDPDGNVTYREAATVQPFANTMVTTTLTGAQLKRVLEQQWQPAGASRPFLKLGVSKGFSYTYDPTAPAGAHITTMTLDGVPVSATATYTVAANSFLAAGGDNFGALAEGAGRTDTGKVDLQSMVDWFEAAQTATPDLAQRAVGVVLSTPAVDGYHPGDGVSLSLSSLAFTAGEAAPGDVSVSLGGRVLASSPVDAAAVDGTDEAGRATLSFALPAGVTGAQHLSVSVAGTGTEVQVPIQIVPTAPATLVLTADTFAAGGVLPVAGEGFRPGERVSVALHGKKGEVVPAGSAAAGSDGVLDARLTVPAGAQPGKYTLVVTRADGTGLIATVHVNRGADRNAPAVGARIPVAA